MVCDESYFEHINTEQKAYWLGFLYADGCVTIQKSSSLILCLAISDFEHVKLFQQCLKTDYNISFGKNNKYARLAIYKKKLVSDLIDKGCVLAKSLILKFPNEKQVPSYIIRHFIRGYFDGDGCIYTHLRHKKNSECVFMNTEVNFLGTQDFLHTMATFLPVKATIEKREKDNIFALRIYDKQSILELMRFMYDNSSIYLERKYRKFEDVKNYVNNKTISLC